MNHKLFTSLIAKRVYPHLRAQGFRGSGTTLRRMGDDAVEVFNVQGSSGGERCYLNLGVHLAFLPTEGGQLLALRDVKEYHCAFRLRIDPPPDQPFGWHYGATEAQAEANVERIVQAWESQAQPFFARHAYPAGLAQRVDEASLTELHPRHLLTLAHVARQLGALQRSAALAEAALRRVGPAAVGLRQDIQAFLAGGTPA